MKNIRILPFFLNAVLTTVLGSSLLTSCVKDIIPETYYSSNELLIGQYLSSRPDDLSEFTKILDTTGTLGLLNAYGKYTCFIPNNTAMRKYYLFKGRTGRSEFTMDELKKICYNHIIKGDTIDTGDFSVGPLSTLSMNERFVNINYSLKNGSIQVNDSDCIIIEKDIRVHNGYIHILNKPLEPSELKLGEKIAQDPKFSLIAQALEMTGYAKIMNDALVEDESYDPTNCPWKVKTYNIKEEIPQHRKFGFTVLLESDETLSKYTDCPLCPNGVNTIDDLKNLAKYYYSRSYEGNFSDGVGVDDPKDPRNYLNRFVAYHCMSRTLASSRLINDYDTPTQIKTYDMYEFIETMLSNTLIKVKKDRDYPLTFFINMWDENDINTGIQLTSDFDNEAINGYYHEIDKPLVYSKNVVSNIASNRIRMEASSFFPEFATNNMRGNNPTAENVVGKAHRYIIPNGFCDGLKCSATTRFTYLNANGIYEDWQGDEIYVEGTYNFSILTAPIPAGTYEVRMSYQPTDWRGIAQLYWDSIPCGIPLNLALLANNAEVGWVSPGADPQDPEGYENDKMMHNRGYMKGACSYKCTSDLYYNSKLNARQSIKSLRRVLGTYTFDKASKHTFTVVGLGSTTSDIQFMLDYLEFVPTELLETEGID